jgi:hypothetical protein
MTSWPVLVQHWQIECCGVRFAVGDDVAWQFVFRPYDKEWDWPERMVVDVVPLVWWEVNDDGGTVECARLPGGIEVALEGEAVSDHERLRGTLIEEHHGRVPEELAVTTATVRGIRVASQEYRRVGAVGWVPVPATVQLTPVDRVPAFFRDLPTEAGANTRMIDLGVLADIETHTPSATV